MSDEEIAEAWLTNCRDAIQLGSDSDEATATFWAYSELDRLCSTDSDRALEIIRLIAKEKPEDRVIYNLAAGPLEDLLVRHGVRVIDRIERLAHEDASFLFLVSGVWPERMPPTVQPRIHSLIAKAESDGVASRPESATKH